jgi:hypothetical protein
MLVGVCCRDATTLAAAACIEVTALARSTAEALSAAEGAPPSACSALETKYRRLGLNGQHTIEEIVACTPIANLSLRGGLGFGKRRGPMPELCTET